jgi:hypothetical protein
LIVGVLWILVTGLLARSQLNQARNEVGDLKRALFAGNVDHAEAIARDLADHAQRAHDLTNGPAWWVGANVPFAGAPLRTARIVSTQAGRLGGTILPRLVRTVSGLHGSSLRHGRTVNLAPIRAAAPVLDHAAGATAVAVRAIRGSPASTWLSPVDDARRSVLADLGHLSTQLTGANGAVHALVPMLGGDGLRRYFVGFENEAESRGLGGIAGAFAIATADHGTIRFGHFGTDVDLAHTDSGVDLGPEFAARYGQDNPTKIFQNSDISPDFRDAAQIWAGMWQAKSGEHVDGAIAIDPSALSYLLAETGPAPLPGGGTASADNIVALTQKTQYERYPATTAASTAARKKFLVSVAKAVSDRLVTGSETAGLVRAALRAGHERRLLIWSAEPGEEAAIRSAGLAGDLTPGSGGFSGFAVTNAAGSKLDYYLDRTMTYRRSGCAAGSSATATLKLTNEAPQSGLPAYVTTLLGTRPPGLPVGTNRLIVSYYATPGARIASVTVDGTVRQLTTQTEQGLTVVQDTIYLRPAQSVTLTVRTIEPAVHGQVRILRQPLVRRLDVSVHAPAC